MKKFITSVPFQPALIPIVYEPVNKESEMYYNGRHDLPILNALNAYVKTGEKAEIILLLPVGSETENNCQKNMPLVLKQIDELVNSKNIDVRVKTIAYNDSDDISVMLSLYGNLIRCFEDNDEIYTCITYGTKPVPLVQMMALRYAFHAKHNIYIGALVYGKVHGNVRNPDGGDLYDMTSLFYMDELSENFCRMGIENPEEKIAQMIFNAGDDKK